MSKLSALEELLDGTGVPGGCFVTKWAFLFVESFVGMMGEVVEEGSCEVTPRLLHVIRTIPIEAMDSFLTFVRNLVHAADGMCPVPGWIVAAFLFATVF